MSTELSPTAQRLQDPLLRESFALATLLPKLPLTLPLPPGTPPSPKHHYRSHYLYLGYGDLADPAAWPKYGPFDLALRLVDFTNLEPLLASILYAPSARGHVPFHPVSLFLLLSWRLFEGWHRTEALDQLAQDRNADYRHYFGFQEGVYPTEGGLRHFEKRLGASSANPLIKQTMELAHDLGAISPEALAEGIFSTDGMLHDAASRLRCTAVTETCYQPVPRPCPAREKKEHKGCDCTETACAAVCKHATPRDPKARFIVYKGHNQPDSPNAPAKADATKPRTGDPRYGYRSVAGRLPDASRRCSWVLNDGFLATTEAEDKLATELMERAVADYRTWINFQVAVADAGEGREPFLSTAYKLGLRRVVGLRKGPGDHDKEEQRLRRYDAKGTPLCDFGYRLQPNGWDYERWRHKWCCERSCEKQTEPPAPDCARRFADTEHGLVVNIGCAQPQDGKTRLARDVAYGSALWHYYYDRGRNAAEERNAELTEWGLKRLPFFGWERGSAQIGLADIWVNLCTLIRLIREVVQAAGNLSPP